MPEKQQLDNTIAIGNSTINGLPNNSEVAVKVAVRVRKFLIY